MLRVNMSKNSKHIIDTLSDLKCHKLGKYGGNLSMAGDVTISRDHPEMTVPGPGLPLSHLSPPGLSCNAQ